MSAVVHTYSAEFICAFSLSIIELWVSSTLMDKVFQISTVLPGAKPSSRSMNDSFSTVLSGHMAFTMNQ